MRDKQVELSGGDPRIPVLSGVLHCVSMSAVVYLRSSFGFAYLRPKSVFFAFSWALVLFTIYAWNEPPVWRQWRAACLFALGSIALYWLHLLSAFIRELHRQGEHDRYSGKSHPVRLMQWAGKVPTVRFEMLLHLWAEPGIILLCGLALRSAFGERCLSAWLFFTAICLWLKEAQNYWHHLRQQKRQEDIFAEAEDTVEAPSPNTPDLEPPKAARKARVKRPRNVGQDPAMERRFAELLRLLPPYSLEKAEEHYRALIKTDHPDANDGTPESTARSVELNDAIEYFRERLET